MRNKSGFYAFILGGLVGSAVALLYAPRSGEETRQLLVENSQEIKYQAIKSIQETQESAEAVINEAQAYIENLNREARERFANLQEIGQSVLDEQKQDIE